MTRSEAGLSTMPSGTQRTAQYGSAGAGCCSRSGPAASSAAIASRNTTARLRPPSADLIAVLGDRRDDDARCAALNAAVTDPSHFIHRLFVISIMIELSIFEYGLAGRIIRRLELVFIGADAYGLPEPFEQ